MTRPWSVRNINTGEKIGETTRPRRVFLTHILSLQRKGHRLYAVTRSCRTREQYEFARQIAAMGVPVVYDSTAPKDALFLLEGEPDDQEG